jgi:hypothetical protein
VGESEPLPPRSALQQLGRAELTPSCDPPSLHTAQSPFLSLHSLSPTPPPSNLVPGRSRRNRAISAHTFSTRDAQPCLQVSFSRGCRGRVWVCGVRGERGRSGNGRDARSPRRTRAAAPPEGCGPRLPPRAGRASDSSLPPVGVGPGAAPLSGTFCVPVRWCLVGEGAGVSEAGRCGWWHRGGRVGWR